jgi:hypothetical protein
MERRAGLQRAGPPERRTPLEPGGYLARVTPLPRRAPPVVPIRPSPAWPAPLTRLPPPRVHAATGTPKLAPGFPQAAREEIAGRSRGACVLAFWREAGVPPCGGANQAHHRQAAGSGGTSCRRKHHPANGILLCAVHHGWAHNHPARARILGLIVGQSGDFLLQPLSYDGGLTWLLLPVISAGHDSVTPGGDAA